MIRETHLSDETGKPKYPDIDPVYHSVVDTYGREMFTLVFNAGMGSQAVQHLVRMTQAFKLSRLARTQQMAAELEHATSVLAAAFNEASSKLAKKEGWAAEMLEECERAIEAAVAAKIAVVQAPKIVLH